MKNLVNLYKMKFFKNLKLDKIVKSKVVLWILFVIALTNMYAYVMSANDLYIAFMFLIGFIISFFTKNMVIILFWAIAIPNLIRFSMEWKSLFSGIEMMTVREGLEDKVDTSSDEKKEAELQADMELSGKSQDEISADKHEETISNSAEKLEKMQGRLKKIIDNAKDQTQNIPDRQKREEVNNLIELEENIVGQLGIIGNMLTKLKRSDKMKASSDKTSASATKEEDTTVSNTSPSPA